MRGNLRMALSSVRGSKWRSMLTMLGIIVGIVAVVTVVGIGEGVKKQVAGTLNHFGNNLIIIRPGQVSSDGTFSASNNDVLFGLGNSSSLSIQDVQTVQKTDGVIQVSPLGLVPGTVSSEGHSASNKLFVLAAGSDVANVLNQGISQGEMWTSEDSDTHTAVIGRDVAQELFGEPVPLGHSFTLRGQSFMVRGIFDRFADVPFSPTANFDNAIFIPYQAAAQLTKNSSGLYVILAKAQHANQVNQTAAALTTRLRDVHGGTQDFTVLSPRQSVAMGGDVIHLLTTWIVAVAVISLFIGGVGIMNIMLLNVTERMHEIGVRKAIGASSRQILGQFMFEAAVLSLLGGVVGIVVSLAVVGLLYTYTELKPIISWHAIITATVVSIVIGIVFGTAPAVKAARKDPIEALRHE